MKKLFVYRVAKNDWYSVIKIYFYKLVGYKVFVWGIHNLPIINYKKIIFPPANKSVEYEPIARKKMANYFELFFDNWSKDIYRRDYIVKTLDMSVLDYYTFEETILSFINQGDRVKMLTPSLFFAINRGIKPARDFSVALGYPVLVIRLTIRFLRDLYLSLAFKGKIPIPNIIYYRKKLYPDLGEYSCLYEKINTRESKVILGAYPVTSRGEKKFGFYFLNSFKGMSEILIKSYFLTLRQSFSDLAFLFKNGVNKQIFKKYLMDTYIANIFSKMSPLVICGVLVDKPLYILFYKYKNINTKMVSLNESFFFQPNRSFDYNYLDRYYSMNKIDEKMQNIHGGDIKSFKQVEFFRNVAERNNGLSDELSSELKKYKYCILLLPAQVYVEKTGFYYWAYDELESFIKSTLNLASSMTDTLFIVKGKKGELRLLPKWFQDLDRNNSNIFVINCEKPRELESNRFEDLVGVVDLTISMALTSTTVWQSIARNKPVIAINRTKYPSILANYKGYESSLSEVHNNIVYWRSLSKSETLESIELMKKDFNIGQSDGLSQVALDLKKFID